MRIRIIIDTQDAEDPDAVADDTPFTLNVYEDGDDGTPSQDSLSIGSEGCLIGGSVAEMLEELSQRWGTNDVLNQTDMPLPSTSEQWRAYETLRTSPCDECRDRPATHFWPDLPTPVQLCDSCLHDARRSGWEPGA